VNTKREARLLAGLDIDYAQVWLYGKPFPAAKLRETAPHLTLPRCCCCTATIKSPYLHNPLDLLWIKRKITLCALQQKAGLPTFLQEYAMMSMGTQHAHDLVQRRMMVIKKAQENVRRSHQRMRARILQSRG
jgi:hypothetical protein